MELKIVLVLTVVALSTGCCEAYINIHGDMYEKRYTKAELDSQLTDEFAPSAREVARVLARAANKFEALEASKGVEIIDLMEMTSCDVSCDRAKFAQYEEWRQLFSGPGGNIYLLNYVSENFKRLYKYCANNIDKTFDRAANLIGPQGGYLEKITNYIDTTDQEWDPQERTVENFLAAKILNEEEKQELVQTCAALEPRVKASLFYFIDDEKMVSTYLDNLGCNPQTRLYKRCKVINKMFGKQ